IPMTTPRITIQIPFRNTPAQPPPMSPSRKHSESPPRKTLFETAFENSLRNQTPPEDPFDSQPATSLTETLSRTTFGTCHIGAPPVEALRRAPRVPKPLSKPSQSPAGRPLRSSVETSFQKPSEYDTCPESQPKSHL